MAIKRPLPYLNFNEKVKRRKIIDRHVFEFILWVQSEKIFITKFIDEYLYKYNQNPIKVLKWDNKNELKIIDNHFRFLVLHNSGFTNKVIDSIIYKNVISSFCFMNYVLSPIKNIEKLKKQHGEISIRNILERYNPFKFVVPPIKIKSKIKINIQFMNFKFSLKMDKEKYPTIKEFKEAIKKHFYHPSNSSKKIIVYEKQNYFSIMNKMRIINRVFEDNEKLSNNSYYFIKFEE